MLYKIATAFNARLLMAILLRLTAVREAPSWILGDDFQQYMEAWAKTARRMRISGIVLVLLSLALGWADQHKAAALGALDLLLTWIVFVAWHVPEPTNPKDLFMQLLIQDAPDKKRPVILVASVVVFQLALEYGCEALLIRVTDPLDWIRGWASWNGIILILARLFLGSSLQRAAVIRCEARSVKWSPLTSWIVAHVMGVRLTLGLGVLVCL